MSLSSKFSRPVISLVLLAIGPMIGCGGIGGGGGGGGSDFVGAAIVNIDTTPTRIDPADRTQTTVYINEAHENGILLKVRYPKGLRYVAGTAFLKGSQKKLDATPIANVSGSDEKTYLVFCLPDSSFDHHTGTLTLELEGVEAVQDGRIEVDADVRSTATQEACTFNVETPEFGTEDDIKIEVID